MIMTPADVTALVTAVCGLIVAMTNLIKILQVHTAVKANSRQLQVVDDNTNGRLSALQQQVSHLETTQATPAELISRG